MSETSLATKTVTIDDETSTRESTTNTLARLAPPHFDEAEWAMSRDNSLDTSPDDPPPLAVVGDQTTFLYETGTATHREVATLVYANDAVTMWFAGDVDYDEESVAEAADIFLTEIFPAATGLIGRLDVPGIDGDPRVAVLHTNLLEGSAGEFAASDLLPRSLYPASNGREMLYIAGDIEIGSDFHLGVMAHEFTHLLDWQYRPNRPLWLAEGLAQLVEHRSGTQPVTAQHRYLAKQPVQLNAWGPLQLDDRHYGAAYLYLVYVWQEFGDDTIRDIVQSPYDGIGAIADALERQGKDHTEFFGEWIAAMVVDSKTGAGFDTLDLPQVCGVDQASALPWSVEASVPQFAPRYLNFTGSGLVELSFKGSPSVGPIADEAYDGEWMWWAGPADESAARLTRSFDLRGLDDATLTFAVWHDTGYFDTLVVLVSTDGGTEWTVVDGPESSPAGFSLDDIFEGYTAWSGSGLAPEWITETIDLGNFVGREVLVRFQYATDLYEGRIGVALDNIDLVELSAFDGAENADSDWVTDGFGRVPESVPQPWIVQVIDENGATLIDLNDSVADFQVELSGGGVTTVAIAATASGVGTNASYELTATGLAFLTQPDAGAETFDLPCGGWEYERTSTYSLEQRSGALVVTVHEPDEFTWSAHEDVSDIVTVTTDMAFGPIDDGAGGLFCRYSAAGFYEFDVATDGTYLVGVADGDEYEVLVDWTVSQVINTGPFAKNKLSLACGDGGIVVSINDVEVDRVADDRLPPGRVAVVATSFESREFEVSYDNVVIASDPLGRGALLAFESFDTNQTSIDVYTDRGASVQMEKGELVLAVDRRDWSGSTSYETLYSNASLSADFRITEAASDGAVGATCAGNDVRYLMLLAMDGSYLVQREDRKQFTEVVPWTFGSNLILEPETANHMVLTCAHGRLVWQVNGDTLVDVEIDDLEAGSFGFLALTFDYGRLEMRIDNVSILSITP